MTHERDAGTDDSEGELPTLVATDPTLDRSGELEATALGLASEQVQVPDATPDRIGRFVVLSRLGAGGMGVVYAARDPELDRRVALKVLHPGPGRGSNATARLLREAQATARLSHPNVVQIYEVGTHRGQVYLALEYVEGTGLERWLRAQPREWAEVCRLFVQAGRGLAAAHAVGLVHRDFKPENAIVGDDGRLRVLDFGIARLGEAETGVPTQPTQAQTQTHAQTQAGPELPEGNSVDSVQLTAVGSIVGTPAYMAPEQFRGAPTTPATDQFSFAVALYEAVYGQRPFAGTTRTALMMNVVKGRQRPLPSESKVPTWLHEALQRSLSVDPEQRFPSIEALLDVIEAGLQPPVSPLRRALGPLMFAAASFAVALGWSFRATPQPQCDGGPLVLAEVWSDARRAELDAAFRATKLAYADDAWAKADARLDALTDRWLDQHRDNCEATRIRGQQSDARMDLRATCLDDWLDDADALLDVLASPDEAMVERAVQAVDGLGDPSRCGEVERLERGSPPPAEQAEAIAEVRSGLRVLKAQRLAGHYDDGAGFTDLSARATATGWEPLELEVLDERLGHQQALGQYEDAKAGLTRLHLRTLALGRPGLAARASLGLATVVGQRLGEHERGLQHADVTEALIEVVGGDEPLATELLRVRGLLHERAGDLDAAVAAYREHLAACEAAGDPLAIALALGALSPALRDKGEYAEATAVIERGVGLLREVLGDDHPEVASSLRRLADLQARAGEFEAAEAAHRASLATLERALGPDHPRLAISHLQLGALHHNRKHYDDALAEYARAVAILEGSLGPDTPDLVDVLNNQGAVYLDLDRPQDAHAALERALTIQRSAAPRHFKTAVVLSTLAAVLNLEGDREGSIALNDEALAIMKEVLGPEHPHVAAVSTNIAVTLGALGRHAEAEAYLTQAIAILEAKHGRDHHLLIDPLDNLANNLARQGRLDEGAALATRALTIELAHDRSAAARGKTRMIAATHLYASGQDRERARELIAEALAELEGDDSEAAVQRRERLLAWDGSIAQL